MAVVKKARGLGKGLDALLGKKDDVAILSEDKDSDTIGELAVELLQAGQYQPRTKMDPASLEELAQSIREQGLISPILVRPIGKDKYEIIAGERRFRASKIAGLNKVPVIVKNYDEKQIKEISLIENLQREDLNPIEAATAMKQLMDDYGLTQEELAERIAKSRSAVANTLRLLTLDNEVVKLVANGKLSSGHARALVTLPLDMQKKIANNAVKNGMSVRDVEKATKDYFNPPSEIKKTKMAKQALEMSAELKDLIARMQQTFGTKVAAIGNDKKGRIYIDYYTTDDLDRLSEIVEMIEEKNKK